MTNHNNNNTESNIARLRLSVLPGQEIFPSFVSQSAGSHNFGTPKYHRKKRTKLIRIDNPIGVTSGSTSGAAKPKFGKKPDPSAPKITRPCSECGKKFWSWKALFGHMRCHPERQWRGINPPPNDVEVGMNHEDDEVAACLLMLADAPSAFETQGVTIASAVHGLLEYDIGRRDGVDGAGPSGVNCRFECSSCNKVFGSHQALGGHRASHKNVKGCFSITRSDELDHNGGHVDDRSGEREVIRDNGDEKMVMVMVMGGYKCSVCLRVFSSGQALAGHKRCHWGKGDEPSSLTQGGLSPFGATEGCALDLNLPVPVDEDDSSSSYSSQDSR